MVKFKTVFLFLIISSSVSAGIFEAWRGFSDPEIMGSNFNNKFSALPLEGATEENAKYWSAHYWPSQKGGINHRWLSEKQEMFNYKSPSKSQVVNMSEKELSTLSPSEKYDLFIGNYSYPLKSEAEGTISKRAPDWAGICHGWAPAALHHNEPTPKVVTNPDGLRIPFGSADIKAILSYYYAFHYEAESTHQMGLRCFFGNWLGGARGCDEDLNAGAFHIVLANKLGLERSGFIADIDRFKEVWNQPVVGYKSKIVDSNLRPSPRAARKAVKEMRIATDLFYVDESDAPTWEVVHGTKDQVISKKELMYRIELDQEGKIVGGEWESDTRPDFLWNKERTPSFDGIFSRLPELLND